MSKRRTPFSLLLVVVAVMAFVVADAALVLAADGFPVNSYYGVYDAARKETGRPCGSLRGPNAEQWKSAQKVQAPKTVGVLFPHLKDSYWLAVNYGIIDRAKELGLSVKVLEAGGYENLAQQQAQFQQLLDSGVDAVILGSISYNGNNAYVKAANDAGVPVVAVINDVEAPGLSGKAMVSFFDMGYFAGEFVSEDLMNAGVSEASVIALPGPKNSGWADDSLEGFKAATEFSDASITVASIKWGSPDAATQSRLLEEALSEVKGAAYVVGNAVAATAAVDVLKKQGVSAKVVSTYITPEIYEMLTSGKVAAAPADMTVDQGRMSVDMVANMLNGLASGKDFPFRSGPIIPVTTTKNIAKFSYEDLFGPRGFKPVMSTN